MKTFSFSNQDRILRSWIILEWGDTAQPITGHSDHPYPMWPFVLSAKLLSMVSACKAADILRIWSQPRQHRDPVSEWGAGEQPMANLLGLGGPLWPHQPIAWYNWCFSISIDRPRKMCTSACSFLWQTDRQMCKYRKKEKKTLKVAL